MKTKRIEISNGQFEDFEVFELDLSIGQLIWWVNDYNEVYEGGIITKIDPDHWWIYENGHKALGCVIAQCLNGENYQIDFCDILVKDPTPTIVKINYEEGPFSKCISAEMSKDADIEAEIDREVRETWPKHIATHEQFDYIKTLPRTTAIKYIKDNVKGIDGLKSAAIFYDTYSNEDYE